MSDQDILSTLACATAQPAGIDVAKVTEWLQSTTDELAGPFVFTRIGGGQSNLTYRIDDRTGRQAVLRRPPLGEVLESAHNMARECHVLERLVNSDMPVPRPLALCEDPGVSGAPFYVMDHIDGLILTTVDVAGALPRSIRRAAGMSLAQTLARLQSVDLDAAGFADMRRPRDYCDRQLRRWRSQWEASRTRDLPLVDEVADRLAAAMPAEDETVLVHGDYRLDNAVLRADGTIAAVLDWELCTVGHPLADVGLMLAYWEEAAEPEGLFGQAVTALPGFPTIDELSRAYEADSGRDIVSLDFFIAFAYWKIAIIVEGVHRRWLNDPINGAASAGKVGESVERLTRLADVRARRGGF